MPLVQIFLPLAVAVAMQTLPTFSNLAATTLAPEILPALGLTPGAANVYVFLLYAAATLGSFWAASFVMRLGPVRAGQAALLLIAVGGLAIFAAPTAPVFVLVAIAYGLAYVVPIPAGAQILTENAPAHLRNTLFGIRQMGVPMGGLLAGLAFPPIAEAWGWQAAFVATGGCCLLLAVALQACRGRFDASRRPELSVFGRSAHGPMTVLRSSPGLRRLCVAGLLFAGTEMTAVANIVLYLERSDSWSLIEAGYALGALSVGGAIGRLFWGMAADRAANRIRLLGCLGLGMAAAMAALAAADGQAHWFAYVAAFLVGFTAGGWTGVGIAEAAQLSGRAGPVAGVAALTQMMFLGVVSAPLAFGVALAVGVDYSTAFTVIGGLAGVGGLLLLIQPSSAPDEADGKIPWTPLLLTMLTQALATMAAYTLSTASPFIAPDLGVENEDVAQLVSIVYLMGAGSALLIPPFIRRFGGMAVSIAICCAAAAMMTIAAFAGSIVMLVFGAVALGCLYGGTAPSSSFVLAKLAPLKRRNLVFSIRQIGVPLGGVLGGIMVPPLILIGGWRIAFEAQLVFALLLILAIYLVRHRYDRDQERSLKLFDMAGPLRLLRLLKELPELAPLSVACFVYSGAQLCFGAYLVTQVVRVFGDSAYGFASAVALVAFQLSGIGARIALAIVADAWVSARTLLAILGMIMAGAAVIAANYEAAWPLWLIVANSALAGASASGYTGLAFAEYSRIAGVQRTAEATALGAATMFIGVAVMAPLFRVGIDVFDGYRMPYLAVAGLTLASAALLIATGRRTR